MTTEAKEQDAPALALRAGEHLTRGANELYALSPQPIPLGPTAGAGADVGRLIYRRDGVSLDLLHNVSRNGMLALGGAAVWMLLAFVGVFFFVVFMVFYGGFTWANALGMWGGAPTRCCCFLAPCLCYPTSGCVARRRCAFIASAARWPSWSSILGEGSSCHRPVLT